MDMTQLHMTHSPRIFDSFMSLISVMSYRIRTTQLFRAYEDIMAIGDGASRGCSGNKAAAANNIPPRVGSLDI